MITLGIIGVVAAVILPSLISDYQEKALINQLSKAYALLDTATQKMFTEENIDIKDFGETPEERIQKYIELLPKHVKIIKACAEDEAAGTCNAKSFRYLNIDGQISVDNYYVISRKQTLVLANGMSIIFFPYAGQCALYKNFIHDNSYNGYGGGTYGWACGSFYIDINGKKGPNLVDKDIFLFWIVRDGIIPAGMPQESVWCQTFENACGRNATKSDALHMCTAWALQNKNMDYLKCNGLSWTGKQSCKD